MKIQTATRKYEAWLTAQTNLDEAALQLKHRQMEKDAFRFLRASFYRWAQSWPVLCPDLVQAPRVLGVGDLHVENFGIWPNFQGELVWGINDFDEAWPLPYTQDLTRLAASVYLANRENLIDLKFKSACKAILDGYLRGLEQGGKPFLQADQPAWMQKSFIESISEKQKGYWKELRDNPSVHADEIEAQVGQILQSVLSGPSSGYTFHKRTAGLGSLGKPRWIVVARAEDLAWEAKALTISAWNWANPSESASSSYHRQILQGAVRSGEADLQLAEGWILRRLSPQRVKLDLKLLDRLNKDEVLLFNMGWETANIHLGSEAARQAVLEDIQQRSADWLRKAAKLMAETTQTDWQSWAKKR